MSKYVSKAQCIIDQYSNYSIPELGNLQLNGFNTQGENIADNGGIKQAFRAYSRWKDENGLEESLPSLPVRKCNKVKEILKVVKKHQ